MYKKLLIVLLTFLLPVYFSCRSKNIVNENTEKKTEAPLKKISKDISGKYRGTAKISYNMELNIFSDTLGNLTGESIIYWKPNDPVRANFKGKYNEADNTVNLLEDESIKGAGYFKGILSGDALDGDWFRYSNNGSYKWELRKTTSGNDNQPSGQNDIKEFLNQFKTDFNSKNPETINTYIDSELGLFILFNPGAFVYPYHFNNFTELKNSKGYEAINTLNKSISCAIQNGSRPVLNCENNRYNKSGCFYFNVSSAGLLKSFSYLTDKSDKDLNRKAGNSDKYASYGLCSTIDYVVFYFGNKNNKWILLAIDVSDCSA